MMTTALLDRVTHQKAGVVVRGVPLGEIRTALESAGSAGRVAADLGLGPLDVVAAVAAIGLGVGAGAEGPPLVHERSGFPGLAGAVGEASLGELFPEAPRAARLALSAGLAQALDLWDL